MPRATRRKPAEMPTDPVAAVVPAPGRHAHHLVGEDAAVPMVPRGAELGSPPDPALLEMPFDQFQRYQVTLDVLRLLGLNAGVDVLEVGGAPGPIEAFLPECEVVVLDRFGSKPGRFVRADGARLPFPDAAFPVVVCLDTLEHVPPADRPALLRELRRVSSAAIVVSAPFAGPDVRLAEEALGEFIRHRLGDFATLDEHAEHGLPELGDALAVLAHEDWHLTSLPSGYLPRWLATMVVHHELLATGLPQLGRLHAYYNATVSPADCRAPSYRQVIVAARGRSQAELDAIVDDLTGLGDEEAARTALTAMAAAVLQHRLGGALRSGEVGALEAEITALRQQVDERDRNHERVTGELRARVAQLEAVLLERDQRINEQQAAAERLRADHERDLHELSQRLGALAPSERLVRKLRRGLTR